MNRQWSSNRKSCSVSALPLGLSQKKQLVSALNGSIERADDEHAAGCSRVTGGLMHSMSDPELWPVSDNAARLRIRELEVFLLPELLLHECFF